MKLIYLLPLLFIAGCAVSQAEEPGVVITDTVDLKPVDPDVFAVMQETIKLSKRVDDLEARVAKLEAEPKCCPIPPVAAAKCCGCPDCTGKPDCPCKCDNCKCRPKVADKYELLFFTQDGCGPCEELLHRLDGMPFKVVNLSRDSARSDSYRVSESVRSTPQIAVYDPAKKQFSKFTAGGMTRGQVEAAIENAKAILERPEPVTKPAEPFGGFLRGRR